MKKFFNVLLLVGFFISFTAIDSNAQTIDNQTTCNFRIAIEFGDFACNSTGVTYLVVPPGVTNLSFPPGSRIMASKGYPLTFGTSPSSGCVYYIGRTPCNGYPTSDFISCGVTPCGTYTASLNASFSTITIQ